MSIIYNPNNLDKKIHIKKQHLKTYLSMGFIQKETDQTADEPTTPNVFGFPATSSNNQ